MLELKRSMADNTILMLDNSIPMDSKLIVFLATQKALVDKLTPRLESLSTQAWAELLIST